MSVDANDPLKGHVRGNLRLICQFLQAGACDKKKKTEDTRDGPSADARVVSGVRRCKLNIFALSNTYAHVFHGIHCGPRRKHAQRRWSGLSERVGSACLPADQALHRIARHSVKRQTEGMHCGRQACLHHVQL